MVFDFANTRHVAVYFLDSIFILAFPIPVVVHDCVFWLYTDLGLVPLDAFVVNQAHHAEDVDGQLNGVPNANLDGRLSISPGGQVLGLVLLLVVLVALLKLLLLVLVQPDQSWLLGLEDIHLVV